MLSKDQRTAKQAGPPFVKCLCLHLRYKVQHLRAHYLDDVALPGLEMGGMALQEEQDVFLWLLRELWWLARALVTLLLRFFGFYIQTPDIIILTCGSSFGFLFLFWLITL